MITVASLIAAGLGPTQARLFAQPLAAACARFEINTPQRAGALVGQCRLECSNFTRLEENLLYTTPARIMQVFPSRVRSIEQAATLVRNPKALANFVYAGRNGNGNEASGDGWRYRGQGAIHLTGLGNYRRIGALVGRPYVERPGLVSEPEDAALTAAAFWHENKLNAHADAGRWSSITRGVNGPAMLHARDREAAMQRAIKAFQ